MSDYSAVERRMADELPQAPAYRALTRVFASKVMLLSLCVAVLSTLVSGVNVFVSMYELFPLYQQSLCQSANITNPAAYESLFKGIYYGVFIFALLLSAGIALLQFLPQALLISRARRGRLLGRRPFTVLRTYCLVILVLTTVNLVLSLIMYAAIDANGLALLTLALSVACYGALVRYLGMQREIAMWGIASKSVPYKPAAFLLAVQVLPSLATLLLTVLQYVNPDYFKLYAYSSATAAEFLLQLVASLLAISSTLLYTLTILRAEKAAAAPAAPEQPELP